MRLTPASKLGEINFSIGEFMKIRKFYRDGVEEIIFGPIRIHITSDGHVVESYKTEKGKRRYFATLSGTHWCAHGDSIASAVSDAIWKDPAKRPSLNALKAEIRDSGKKRKITLNEFRVLTGACLTGCRTALERAGRDETPLTAFEIREHVSKDWGDKLLSVLEWMDD
jgi:hypothetical protein